MMGKLKESWSVASLDSLAEKNSDDDDDWDELDGFLKMKQRCPLQMKLEGWQGLHSHGEVGQGEDQPPLPKVLEELKVEPKLRVKCFRSAKAKAVTQMAHYAVKNRGKKTQVVLGSRLAKQKAIAKISTQYATHYRKPKTDKATPASIH
jgi:hypothetical protein